MALSMGSLYTQEQQFDAMGNPLVGGEPVLSTDALTAMGFNPADFVRYNGGWATDLGGANSVMLQPRADGSGFDVVRPLDKYVSEQRGYTVQDGQAVKQGEATQFRANTGTTGIEKLALGALAAMGGYAAGSAAGAWGGAAPAGATAGTTAGTASGAINPALIESAVGSAGYGASSAGAGAAANMLSPAAVDALYNMPAGWQEAGTVAASQAAQSAPSAAPATAPTGSPASQQPSPTPGLGPGGLLDFLRENPRLALGLLGGLLGSQGGGGQNTAPGANGPPVKWNSGLQLGIQPTTQRAQPNALPTTNRFSRG